MAKILTSTLTGFEHWGSLKLLMAHLFQLMSELKLPAYILILSEMMNKR